MEGALMGAATLIGSDISEKAVSDTQTNMAWLMKRFDLHAHDLQLFTSPAAELSTHYQNHVDMVVTEVYLGPQRTSPVDTHDATMFEKKMLPLYEESLAGLKPLLKSDGVAVIAFPALKQKDGAWHRLPLNKIVSAKGYQLKNQFLYARSGQLVARDIVVLTCSP